MPIRWRLTLWFALILLFILIFAGIVLNVLLEHYLFNDVDSNLNNFAARVHGSVNSSSTTGSLDYNMIHSSLPAVNDFASPGIYIQLIDADGAVVVKSDSLSTQELPVDPPLIQRALNGQTAVQTVAAGNGIDVRILVSPLYMPGQTLVLEVAQSLGPVESALRQFRLALASGTVVALVLTGILGALLVRRTLKPVENITKTAQNIAASSQIDRRVGYRGPSDEIGRLAKTFDGMLDRLEKVFKSQKEFIADASHELRTPLTVIQGNLALLRRNMGEESRQESLNAIDSESKRMARITADLLLLAEVDGEQGLKKESVPLKTLAEEEIGRVSTLGKQPNVKAGKIEDLSVKGNKAKLQQVLSNLIENAVKYTPKGGAITVSVFRRDGWACLEVADTGIGIAAEDLPRLFDRFYRVDKAGSRSAGGTGLGLAIVKRVIEQHDGKVTVKSELGKGSVFTVWLKI